MPSEINLDGSFVNKTSEINKLRLKLDPKLSFHEEFKNILKKWPMQLNL